MGNLKFIALAIAGAAAPMAAAQNVPDNDLNAGLPQVRLGSPAAAATMQAAPVPPGAGISWREHGPAPRRMPMAPPLPHGAYAPPPQQHVYGAPPPPPMPPQGMPPHGMPGHGQMGGDMRHHDGGAMGGDMRHHDGGPPMMGGMHGNGGDWRDGRSGHGGYGRHDERRRIEIRRFGGGFIAPQMGWDAPYGYEQAPYPPPPPPCDGPCGHYPGPGYGYSYGGGYGDGGTVVVTETTVTERPVVEERTYYTTVRERVRVAARHVVRHCRCKLVKARPRAGERG